MKIAIYCGSSMGNNKNFEKKTKELGKFLALNGIDLVYGGGKVGLMGVIANSFMENGAKVYGIIPKKLKEKEIAHTNITELKIVNNMHERKAMMANLADAFIALPGGTGTLEEIFEAWTWSQIGYHLKPCAFFNIEGFYDKLFEMLEYIKENGFLKKEHINMLIKTDSKEKLLEAIKAYKPPKQRW